MAKKLTKGELKQKAQYLLMEKIAAVGYGDDYSDFTSLCEENGFDGEEIMYSQMNRIAKIFGFEEAWFA